MTPPGDLTRYRDELVPFKAGAIIFQKDTPGRVMYLVTQGEVDILIHGNVVEKERFEQQVRKSPGFSLQVMRIMAERLRRLDKFI